MKKTLMSVVMASVLMTGSAFAALDGTGKGDNGDSQAELHFTGKVTTSLCQVATGDVKKEISLGEISTSQLKSGTGRAPSHSFSVELENCDPSLAHIYYTIQDANGSNHQEYLLPKKTNTSAEGVGIFITDADGNALTKMSGEMLPATQTIAGGTGPTALPTQSIALAAYMGTIEKKPVDGTTVTVTPGDVDATGIMTIKTSDK